jgi:hypothetical protein
VGVSKLGLLLTYPRASRSPCMDDAEHNERNGQQEGHHRPEERQGAEYAPSDMSTAPSQGERWKTQRPSASNKHPPSEKTIQPT